MKKTWRGIATLLLFTAVPTAALAETLLGHTPPGNPAGGPAATSFPLVPAKPVPRVAPQERQLDRNANRIADGLEARLAAAADGDEVAVIVLFDSAEQAGAARHAISSAKIRHVFELVPGFSATMTAAQARALAARPGVTRIEEVVPVYANLDSARHDFGIDSLPPSGSGTLTGAGIGICTVDTGINAQHEQLDNSKVIGFKDFVGNSTTPYDDHGHGTHVAAIAAGDGTGSSFAAPYHGVAPGAALYAAKVLDANGSGTNAAVMAGVDWCASQPGVRVINLSLGDGSSSDGNDAMSAAVDKAVTDKGKVVVVAAGNSGAASYTVGSPGAARQAITVGAAAEWSSGWYPDNASDGIFLAGFSSRGPTADGRIKPDIVAPGHSIISAYPDFWGGLLGCTVDCYAVMSGTSMASPFVAGTAALMLQANSTLKPAELSGMLAATARDRGPKGSGGKAVKDNLYGAGLLDGYAAVAQAAGMPPTPTAMPAYLYGTGTVRGPGVTRIAIDVTDTSAPLAVAVTILDGGLKLFCDIFLGCFYEWRPDFDVRLLYENNPNPVVEGICMLGAYFGQECDNYGRQETLRVPNPMKGRYWLEVYKGTSDSRNGKFSYEVSRGPLGIVP
jgi:serine protease AprX